MAFHSELFPEKMQLYLYLSKIGGKSGLDGQSSDTITVGLDELTHVGVGVLLGELSELSSCKE